MSNTTFAATFTRWLALSAALAVAGALLASVQHAKAAGFSGYYDPANWVTATSGHGGGVDTSGAPGSITITGPDDGSGEFGYVDYLIQTPPIAGTLSFDWSYFSDDDPGFDAGLYINNAFFLLSFTSGESGSVSVPVAPSSIIGFSVESADNTFGPGVLTISNFSAPIPEPATLTLAALCLLGLAAMRRRR